MRIGIGGMQVAFEAVVAMSCCHGLSSRNCFATNKRSVIYQR